MKVEIIDQEEIVMPSEKFITEAITHYIETSKFPKQLQMKKMDLVIDNNNKLISNIQDKLNKFNKLIQERKNKINALNTRNSKEIARLKMEIKSSVNV